MLRYLKQPADLAQLAHEFGGDGRPLTRDDLVRIARQSGLKARATRLKLQKLDQESLPILAEDRNGGFFVLAKLNDSHALIQSPGKQPELLTREQLDACWAGDAVLLASRAALAGEERKFDFTWFLPAIVKYRRLFGQVLLASLFLQLFALVTPLFFQVVIDKVLVHRGLATLDVLVIGLLGITLFEITLGGLRSYILSHTAFRVDVEMGARVFRHLMSLSVGYFQSQPVGQIVARVRELENIRQFLTGSALTLVLDLAFVFVFFLVMYHFSPLLTLIVLGSVPFYVAISLGVTPALRRRIDERFRRGAESQSFLVESVTGAETLKAMAVEPQMRQRWDELLAAYVRASFRSATLGMLASQGVQLVNKVVVALLLWYGARLVIGGEMTIGQLVAFNMFSGQVSQPILRMAQLWQEFQQFRISIDRLGDLLNTPSESTHDASRQVPPEIRATCASSRSPFATARTAPRF